MAEYPQSMRTPLTLRDGKKGWPCYILGELFKQMFWGFLFCFAFLCISPPAVTDDLGGGVLSIPTPETVNQKVIVYKAICP